MVYFLIVGCLPYVVLSAENRISVNVRVHTEESVNALEGEFIFPKDALRLISVQRNNTVISFWVEQPEVNASENSISFSGINPGGFSGDNDVFSAVFEKKNSSTYVSNEDFTIKNAGILRNDGTGKNIYNNLKNRYSLSIIGDDIQSQMMLNDTEKPEKFPITISQDIKLFDGNPFIVFNTQDKGSGVDHFETKEVKYPWLAFLIPWKKQISPAKLDDEELKSFIYVKAVDTQNNERAVILPPTYILKWYENILTYTILIVLLCAYVIIKKRKLFGK